MTNKPWGFSENLRVLPDEEPEIDTTTRAAVSFLKAKRLKSVAEDAYERLHAAVSLECDHIPDRFGGYPNYYVRWNKKKAIAIIEELIRVKS